MVENIHIGQTQPLQALIQAGKQIFAAAKVAVGPRPHIVARLGADQKLIAVSRQFLPQDAAKILLCRAGHGPVIIGQIKMRDAVVESGEAHLLHVAIVGIAAEIVPKTEGHLWQADATLPAAGILHSGIPAGIWVVLHNKHSYSMDFKDSAIGTDTTFLYISSSASNAKPITAMMVNP